MATPTASGVPSCTSCEPRGTGARPGRPVDDEDRWRDPPFDAVVLAGGAAARLGGADKPGLDLDGRPLLAHVLDAVAAAPRRVVVGPPRDLRGRSVVLPRITAGRRSGRGLGGRHRAHERAIGCGARRRSAVDRPSRGSPARRARGRQVEAAILVDRDGRLNPLAAAWRRSTLLAALAEPPERSGHAPAARWGAPSADHGRGRLELGLRHPGRPRPGPDLVRRRPTTGRILARANVLADWVAQLTAALDLDAGTVDTTLVLDVAREAAHGVARPAAPLTTFLIGLSAGSRGGGQAEVEHAAGIARRLVAEHASAAPPRPPTG